MDIDIREEIIHSIECEIIGPVPNSKYKDETTGEEILLARVHGSPKSKYGAGMLYPQQSEICEDDTEEGVPLGFEDNPEDYVAPEIEGTRNGVMNESGGNEEEPVGLANQYHPSAMGYTIRFKNGELEDSIKLEVHSAYYEKGLGQKPIKRLNKEGKIEILESILSDYWIRRPILVDLIELNLYSLFKDGVKSFDKVIHQTSDNRDWLKLRIFDRSTKEDKDTGYLTYTFTLINQIKGTTDDRGNSKYILYQNNLILLTSNQNLIEPYKEKESLVDTDEEKELSLLYRKKRIFAIGHGTSVSWDTKIVEQKEKVTKVYSSIIPVYDMPQIAPTTHVNLSMLQLSDLGDWEEAKKSLEILSKEYEKWINQIEHISKNSKELENYRNAANANVTKCRTSLSRINKGITFLVNADINSNLVKCFRWMNRAMIWQQQRSKSKIRRWLKTGQGRNKQFRLEDINGESNIDEFPSLEGFHEASERNGRWRPFQLAFILMNIESIINQKSIERKVVDLIWFPTGGGKTEAYLGLAAFNIFYRRTKGEEDLNWEHYGGTTVLMRYTLRLLTTQQYERAASLICACDLIRRENKDYLGEEDISIGLWVGGSSTPNKNLEAIAQLNTLKRNVEAEYNFVVMKCPCCATQIGKVEKATRYDAEKTKGIHKKDGKNGEVYFQCENKKCEYSNTPLPLQVIDELIYRKPPTLILGTVDKFAMITWKKETGYLFGFRLDNERWSRISPPELIIQDELHLIAGPLGTMVGLFETMIQTLCNNYNKTLGPFITNNETDFIPPKIIASSATISRAFEQVQSLYGIKGREQLNIFPAQGLEFGDTWFSEEKQPNVKTPGRKYVGILASGYPSAQTSIVRAYSTVLQKVKELASKSEDNEINYYWTLLGYFNSIRELGGASSLVYGDIRERLGQIHNRELVVKENKRYINKIEELTSRISSSAIPQTLKKLEEGYNGHKNKSLDICLATNMVATGVDISRLGLMFIHGQPKTTAEYIQASSRVGRDLPKGPGLIFTLYSPSKPRDKSQYEQFQGYHSRIYSNVEPTSVTPFSINSREKGLHAILIAMVRHFSDSSLRDNPRIEEEEFSRITSIISELIIARCRIVDLEEAENTKRLLDKRITFWKKGFQYYGDAGNYSILQKEGIIPLLYASSAEVREEIIKENRSLSTPTSMRGVDTESVLSIYSNNNKDGE